MNFVVVGPGAMGTLFAQALALAEHPTVLLGRHSSKLPGESHRVVASLDGSRERLRVPITTDPRIVRDADVILVLVKTFSTVQAMTRVAEHLRPSAVVLSLQNGLGNAEVIRSCVGPAPHVLVGVTSMAGMRGADGVVLHTGVGPTIIGYETPQEREAAERISLALRDAGIATAVSGDIARLVWQKVAVNAAINGLTALGAFPNGRIAEEPDLLLAADIIADEVATVASAEGVELIGVRQILLDTVLSTAANRSSMLQDVEAGRQTEVDSIHGAVVAAGLQHGIACPTTSTIAALIRAKTHNNLELEPCT